MKQRRWPSPRHNDVLAEASLFFSRMLTMKVHEGEAEAMIN